MTDRRGRVGTHIVPCIVMMRASRSVAAGDFSKTGTVQPHKTDRRRRSSCRLYYLHREKTNTIHFYLSHAIYYYIVFVSSYLYAISSVC